MSTPYNARAETTTPLEPAAAERLLYALAGYHPAVGRSVFARTEVTITLPADTLAQATTTALAILTVNFAPADLLSIEVLTTADFDRRLGVEPIPELVSVTQAAEELGVTRQAVLQRIESGSLPATRIGTSWAIPQASLDSIRRTAEDLSRLSETAAKVSQSVAASIDVDGMARVAQMVVASQEAARKIAASDRAAKKQA
jgi:excisionase family DNA binding protein